MAATETIRIPLGFKALDFNLLDTISDSYLSLQQLKGEKATVIMFICNLPITIYFADSIFFVLINKY